MSSKKPKLKQLSFDGTQDKEYDPDLLGAKNIRTPNSCLLCNYAIEKRMNNRAKLFQCRRPFGPTMSRDQALQTVCDRFHKIK